MSSTRQVIAGLEALREENRSLLDNLQETLLSRTSSDSSSLEEEKSGIILQSLDRIELGLGEAQVGSRNRSLICAVCGKKTLISIHSEIHCSYSDISVHVYKHIHLYK